MESPNVSQDSVSDKARSSSVLPLLFVFAGMLTFVVGLANLLDEPNMKWLFLTFFVAPLLTIYPILRYILGLSRTSAGFFSSILALLFYSFIKEKIDKSSKENKY